MADLPSDLVIAGVAPSADEDAATRVAGRWRGAARSDRPGGDGRLHLPALLRLADHRPGAVTHRRQHPEREPAGVLLRPFPGDRSGWERRVVPPPVRRARVARDRARRAGDRHRARRAAWRRRRLHGRVARCDDHAAPRRGDRVPRVRAGGRDRAGSRSERAAHDLGAVLLQRARVCADLARGHAARARADVHDRRAPVGHELPADAARSRRAEHPAPIGHLRAARYWNRDDPRGRAQLRRLGSSATGAELGEHDRPGAEHALRRPALRTCCRAPPCSSRSSRSTCWATGCARGGAAHDRVPPRGQRPAGRLPPPRTARTGSGRADLFDPPRADGGCDRRVRLGQDGERQGDHGPAPADGDGHRVDPIR